MNRICFTESAKGGFTQSPKGARCRPETVLAYRDMSIEVYVEDAYTDGLTVALANNFFAGFDWLAWFTGAPGYQCVRWDQTAGTCVNRPGNGQAGGGGTLSGTGLAMSGPDGGRCYVNAYPNFNGWFANYSSKLTYAQSTPPTSPPTGSGKLGIVDLGGLYNAGNVEFPYTLIEFDLWFSGDYHGHSNNGCECHQVGQGILIPGQYVIFPQVGSPGSGGGTVQAVINGICPAAGNYVTTPFGFAGLVV